MEFPKVFTEVAEKTLTSSRAFTKNCRIINAGVGNMDTLQEEKMLESRIKSVKPELVVLHFYLKDVEPVEQGSSGWLVKNSYMAAFTYIRIRQSAFQAGGSGEGGGIGEYYARLYTESNPTWVAARDAIFRMKKIAADQGAKFAVLIQPDLHDLSDKAAQWKALDFVESTLRNAGIPTEQVAPKLRGQYAANPKSLWVAADDPHPNATGHAAMSEALESLIKSTLQAAPTPAAP